MKVFFKVTVTTADAIECLKSIRAKLGLQNYPLVIIQPVINHLFIAKDSVSGDDTTFNVWLDIPKPIQEISYQATSGGSYTTATMDTLSDDGSDTFVISQSAIRVPEFEAGKAYLIPYTADACTKVIPPQQPMYYQDDADGIILGTHWLYESSSRADLRSGTPFDAYIVQVNLPAAVRAVAEKNRRRTAEIIEFNVANGLGGRR